MEQQQTIVKNAMINVFKVLRFATCFHHGVYRALLAIQLVISGTLCFLYYLYSIIPDMTSHSRCNDAGALYSPVLWCMKWPADGDVSVGGDNDYHPDGTRLCDWCERPHIRLDVRPHTSSSRRTPVGDIMHGLGGLVEQACNQVGGIGGGERLQKEPSSSTDRSVST